MSTIYVLEVATEKSPQGWILPAVTPVVGATPLEVWQQAFADGAAGHWYVKDDGAYPATHWHFRVVAYERRVES